jgi:hypothetical protein
MRTKLLKIMGMATLAVSLLFTFSCTKDSSSSSTSNTLVEDGAYIYGAATTFTTLAGKGLMDPGINEHTTALRGGMYEKYIALKGGANFSISLKAGTVQTNLSPATKLDSTKSGIQDNPQVWFERGTYTSSTATATNFFTVPADGLYLVAIDQKSSSYVIISVPFWGVIGGATPLGWSEPYRKLMPGTFNGTSMKFEITNDTLMAGDFKLRHSGGWKCRFIASCDTITINTNLGGVLANLVPTLVPGGGNYTLPATNRGYYTIDLTWTLGATNYGWLYSMTKTGDVALVNYTNYNMGIIGNAYFKPNTTDTAAWDVNFGTMLPVVSGTTYTWTYDVSLFAGKDFKFRQGTDWNGKSIGYPDLKWAGAAAANFSNDGGNIKVGTSAKYHLIMVIDASTETYTLTATTE